MDKEARVSLGVTFAILGFGPGVSSIGRGY
jgi:hypothetical protein